MDKYVNISKRLSAYLLDIFLIYFLLTLISNIRFINPSYNNLMETSNEYTDTLEKYESKEISEEELLTLNKDYVYKITKYSISTNIACILVIFAYFGLFQKYNNGQTLGKKIMKIKVVGDNQETVSIGKYFLRILPMYYIFIGSVLPLAISSLIVNFVGATNFSLINSIIIYIFFGIGITSFVMMNIRKDKKGLHDLISGTKVIFEK